MKLTNELSEKKLIHFVLLFLLPRLYCPLYLKKLLNCTVIEPIEFNQNANFSHLIEWDKWYTTNVHYDKSGFFACIENIVDTTSEIATIEIQDITALSGSKSNLGECDSLDEFAEKYCKLFIADISEAALNKNLQWESGNILDNPTLYHYAWDSNKLQLSNSGGSHHFAAARYLAKKLNKKVYTTGKLVHKKLSQKNIDKLVNQFDMYIIPESLFSDVMDMLKFILHENYANQSYIWLATPCLFRSCSLIGFLNNNRQARRASKIFKQSGMFDFNQFLIQQQKKQHLNLSLYT
jgi:hypothetical protein